MQDEISRLYSQDVALQNGAPLEQGAALRAAGLTGSTDLAGEAVPVDGLVTDVPPPLPLPQPVPPPPMPLPAPPVADAQPVPLPAPVDGGVTQPVPLPAPVDPQPLPAPDDPVTLPAPVDGAEPPVTLPGDVQPGGEQPHTLPAPGDSPALPAAGTDPDAPATRGYWDVDPEKLAGFAWAVDSARFGLAAVQTRVETMQGEDYTPQLGTSPVGQQLARKFDDRLNGRDGLRGMLTEAMKRMDEFIESAEKVRDRYAGAEDDNLSTIKRSDTAESR